jgi:hypothetical protein
MFESDLDEATASYHEAGHALMAHLLGGRITHMTIEGDEDLQMGSTTIEWHGVDIQDRIYRSALVALAGPIAELRWRGDVDTLDTLTTWRGDWQEVEAALQSCAEGTEHARLLAQWVKEVKQELLDPVAWEMVCRVADALEAHRTLDETLFEDALS